MRFDRRNFLRAALGGVGAAAVPRASHAGSGAGQMPTDAGVGVGVATPDLPTLSPTVEDGVKVFHLVAEPVRTDFMPGRPVDSWGFNGSMPGPTIEVTEGDRVRLVVENRLPELFSMHWHGVEVPFEMDGVPGLTQDPIAPGERFVYEFTLHQNGTFFYHSHMAMQEMMGMIGLFIMHPREPYAPHVDRDFGLIFQEWAILPNNTVPNTMSMEFNWLTINGKAAPATTPLLVRLGERVRIRMVNMGMDHHPVHLHGNTFVTVATEGGRIPETAWQPGNTSLVGVAQARDVEFDAKYVGDWVLHCHLPHHMMNQMVSMVGPMSQMSRGMQSGRAMPEGMGMIRRASALGDALEPSVGRALGVGSEMERAVTHAPLGGLPPAMTRDHQARQHGADGADLVPGFPQDMFMAMDEMVDRPETFGLRPTWTGGMMGMMTMVRVLEPARYDEIQTRIAERNQRVAE